MSHWQNKYDKGGFAKRKGDEGEVNFYTEADTRGADPVKGSTSEDIHHVDWHLTLLSKRTTCDSKARKALRRGWEPTDDWILLENKNVSGKPGWIHGEAEYISFEMSNRYIICPREELPKLWKEIVDETILAKSSDQALGTVYQRNDRLDIISWVKTSDVEKRPGVIIWWKKGFGDNV